MAGAYDYSAAEARSLSTCSAKCMGQKAPSRDLDQKKQYDRKGTIHTAGSDNPFHPWRIDHRRSVIIGVWGAMEPKVRLAIAVSGVSERPELAPGDRFGHGERVPPQQVDVLVAERR